MSTVGIRVAFEPLRSAAFGSISGTYFGIGAEFSHPLRMMIVENLTNATLVFSFDGVNDHFVLPADAPIIMDFSSNKTIANGFYISEGERLYVKEVGTPSSGSVYVSAIYAKE